MGAQVIGLVVDIHADGRGGTPNFKIICHVSADSIAEFVNLFEQALDALAHRFPLFLQAGKLLLQLGNMGGLFFYTSGSDAKRVVRPKSGVRARL